MIRFAVCDDELSVAGYLESLILELNSDYQQKLDITVFLSGEEFCEAINTGQQFDIVLMDIEMGGTTGVEAGRLLRQSISNGLTLLIFVSSHKRYYEFLLDLETFCFVHKPVDQADFKKKIGSAINKVIWLRQMPEGPVYTFKQGKTEMRVSTGEIMYVASENRLVVLHTTTKQKYEFYSNLNHEEKKLPSNKFVRIHVSYIVNFDYIGSISAKSLILKDGTEFPISTQYRQNVKKAYMNYRGGALWT